MAVGAYRLPSRRPAAGRCSGHRCASVSRNPELDGTSEVTAIRQPHERAPGRFAWTQPTMKEATEAALRVCLRDGVFVMVGFGSNFRAEAGLQQDRPSEADACVAAVPLPTKARRLACQHDSSPTCVRVRCQRFSRSAPFAATLC